MHILGSSFGLASNLAMSVVCVDTKKSVSFFWCPIGYPAGFHAILDVADYMFDLSFVCFSFWKKKKENPAVFGFAFFSFSHNFVCLLWPVYSRCHILLGKAFTIFTTRAQALQRLYLLWHIYLGHCIILFIYLGVVRDLSTGVLFCAEFSQSCSNDTCRTVKGRTLELGRRGSVTVVLAVWKCKFIYAVISLLFFICCFTVMQSAKGRYACTGMTRESS